MPVVLSHQLVVLDHGNPGDSVFLLPGMRVGCPEEWQTAYACEGTSRSVGKDGRLGRQQVPQTLDK